MTGCSLENNYILVCYSFSGSSKIEDNLRKKLRMGLNCTFSLKNVLIKICMKDSISYWGLVKKSSSIDEKRTTNCPHSNVSPFILKLHGLTWGLSKSWSQETLPNTTSNSRTCTAVFNEVWSVEEDSLWQQQKHILVKIVQLHPEKTCQMIKHVMPDMAKRDKSFNHIITPMPTRRIKNIRLMPVAIRVCTANPDFFGNVSVTQIMIDPARVFQAQGVQSPWNFALPWQRKLKQWGESHSWPKKNHCLAPEQATLMIPDSPLQWL